jgi:hypothetical protein
MKKPDIREKSRQIFTGPGCLRLHPSLRELFVNLGLWIINTLFLPVSVDVALRPALFLKKKELYSIMGGI